MKKQQADNYYDLLLGTETKRYMFRIFAVKEIIENPERYGFDVKKHKNIPLYNTPPLRLIPR